jgi:4,5-dihydroxyphthalate decarboxylase
MSCSVSLVESALTLPLLEGGVAADGIQFQAARSVDDNSRRMLEGAFDGAEMSLATFVRAVGQGEPLVGLPIFPGRRFVQANMFVHRDSGITTAQGLMGRRVAVPQYWLTSSVWHRGLLADEYGVDVRSIDWFTTASERGAAPLPPGVRVTRVEGSSIIQLFEQRRIDAALMPRPLSRELSDAGATHLLADAPAVQRDYFARTGVFPIMHFIALRRPALDSRPGLAAALMNAFGQAAGLAAADEAFAKACAIAPPIGLAANLATLRRFATHAREQMLVRELPAIEDLFVSIPTENACA